MVFADNQGPELSPRLAERFSFPPEIVLNITSVVSHITKDPPISTI
jgi:hypothetical protein